MSKFVCRNCGFVVEQEQQPDSCPVCGENSFEGREKKIAEPVGKAEVSKAADSGSATISTKSYGTQFREFPGVQKERINRELDAKIETIREEARNYIGEQEAKKEAKKKSGDEWSTGISMSIAFIGMCVSLCRGCIVCGNEDWSRGFPDFIATFVVGMIITCIVAVVLGTLMGNLRSSGSKKHQKNAEKQKDTSEKDINQQQTAAKSRIDEYAIAFEQAVKEATQKFVSNKTTEMIGDRILGSFLEMIERAPRDPRNSDVLVSYSYEVYANQVQYQGGVFGFSQNHCSNLAGPVEQAALAQAIATYLEIRVMERYKRDPSGSVPRLERSYTDTALARKITVSYKAINANYRGI